MRVLVAGMLLLASFTVHAANVALPRFPSISPDGSQICFSWRGDLWLVSSQGGAARRLTANPFNDLHSAFSPDGRRLAFSSDRTGSLNLFMLELGGGTARQISRSDRPLVPGGFGTDETGGEILTVSGLLEPDFFRAPRSYGISSQGGEFTALFEAFGSLPAISPDGTKILLTRGSTTWTRRNYRGPDARELWLYTRADKSYRRLTHWAGHDGRGKWIDNQNYLYLSDRDNTLNLYRRSLAQDEAQARQLTHFKGVDIDDFDVSRNGKTAVIACWDKLYTLDLSQDSAQPKALAITADEDEADRISLKSIDRTITEATLSPDGKTIAYVAYGEIYVRGTESKSVARRVTSTAARERQPVFSADGKKLLFVSDSTGNDGIYAAAISLTRSQVRKNLEDLRKSPATARDDGEEPATQSQAEPESPTTAATTSATTEASTTATHPSTQPDESRNWGEALQFEIESLVVDEHNNAMPSPSPDGKSLAYRRNNGELWVRDLASNEAVRLVDGWSTSLHWRWSPDSRHIAYVTEDRNFNSDIWIVDSAGKSPAVNVTRHPANDDSPRWSADGKILAFLSERTNRENDVWMVYLDKDLETYTAQELEEYFKQAQTAAKARQPLGASRKPTTRPKTRNSKPLDLDDAYDRLRRVTSLPGEERNLEITPDGSKYVFTGALGSERGLFMQDRDSSTPKKIGAAVGVQEISFAGDQVVFVDQGRGGVIKLPAGETEFYDISDKIELDLAAQSEQKFLETSRILGARFADARLNNLDWPALTRRYLPLAREARTADEFDHVGNKFVGELGASHLGVSSPDPSNPQAQPSGRLGIRARRVDNGFAVSWIVPDGPASKGPMRLEVGDVITGIDLRPIDKLDTLESRLAGCVGRETLITVNRRGDEAHLLITPVSYQRYAELHYTWVRKEKARLVDEWSGGKLGYIHLEGMNQPSLDLFERDLYAAVEGRQGLIIDVRNNGGGWTTDRLLASIMAPRHAEVQARGQRPQDRGYPVDRMFIAPYFGPINMLCNERSFSNAEIVSHAFKTLKRGTLIGQQTAGGVLSTGSVSLIDGTSVRLPFRMWFTLDGLNQEGNGAMPDIVIEQTPQQEAQNDDAQLRTAVEDLLKRL